MSNRIFPPAVFFGNIHLSQGAHSGWRFTRYKLSTEGEQVSDFGASSIYLREAATAADEQGWLPEELAFIRDITPLLSPLLKELEALCRVRAYGMHGARLSLKNQNGWVMGSDDFMQAMSHDDR